jgi:hypothetical protein
MFGSNQGLTTSNDQYFNQATKGVAGAPNDDGDFGKSLIAGNFGKSSKDDLAIGSPGEFDLVQPPGEVNVLYGGTNGLTTNGDQLWSQDSPGIADTSENGDSFGDSLAAANLGKTSQQDLAIGVPSEDLGDPVVGRAGALHIIYGTSTGLSKAGDQFWHQDKDEVQGTIEQFDTFASDLAAHNFIGNKKADLVVGIPQERALGVQVGSIQFFLGSTSGLVAGDNDFIRLSPTIQEDAKWGASLGD